MAIADVDVFNVLRTETFCYFVFLSPVKEKQKRLSDTTEVRKKLEALLLYTLNTSLRCKEHLYKMYCSQTMFHKPLFIYILECIV